jgi:multidrug efflux system membrane fusion protein
MKRRTKFFLAGIAVVLLAIMIVRLAAPHGHKKTTAAQPVPVTLATATLRSVPVYLEALGTVVAYRTVTVQPMITGPMTKVLFQQGQLVKQGQALAEIDPAPYQAALAQAKAKLAQDQATLANAQLQEKQYASLVAQHYTSAQQAAAARATALEGAALVKQDEAAVKTDEINLGYTTIRAPITGRTGILQVNAGNIVTPNLTTGIVVINTLQPISVQFSLPQQDLPQIQAAMRQGSVTVIATEEGDPATAKVLDRGVLSVLDNQVNAGTGTLTLKARFPNPNFSLWPGAFVNVRVLVRTDKNVVTVPPVALQQGPHGSFVYALDPGNKVKVVPVSLGYENQIVAVIAKCLAAGAQVVTEGNSRLTAGAIVKPVATGVVTSGASTPGASTSGASTPGASTPGGAAPS